MMGIYVGLQLMDAIQKNDMLKFYLGLRQFGNLNQPIGDKPLLAWAAGYGNLEAVQALIDLGANVNVTSVYSGFTPLMYAICNDRYNIAKLLVDAGADVNTRFEYSKTALMLVCDTTFNNFTLPFVELLLKAGADVNAVSETGYTALMYATRRMPPEVIQILLDAGACKDAVSNEGLTAVDITKFRKRDRSTTEIIKMLENA